jgi:hypothetical protein
MDQQRLRVRAGNADVEDVRDALAGFSDDDEVWHGIDQPVPELIPKSGQPAGVLRLLTGSQLGRATESDGAGDVLRTRSEPTLLGATLNEGMNRVPAADDECADALRTTDLMSGDGQQIAGKLC